MGLLTRMEAWQLGGWIIAAVALIAGIISLSAFCVCKVFFPVRQPILCDIVPSKSSDSKDSVDSTEVPVTVAMVIEETCMLCLEPISGACRELRCCCLVHVDCLLDWWKQSVETRPRQEVASGILQLECRKCRKTVLNVVTKREIQKARL